jgi:hypothetical protein
MLGEPIVEPKGGGGLCTHLRGSVIANSLRIVDQRGLGDAYDERMPDPLREATRTVSVTGWYPIELGLKHYEVVGSLITDVDEQVEIGRQSAAKLQLPYIKTLFRAMKVAGAVTPDRLLTITHKVVDRVLEGADAGVYWAGRKDARLECIGVPLVRCDYFRNSWQGWWEQSISLAASRVFVRTLRHDADSAIYLASWV